jgi:anti-anti-sigma regulatory factor
MFTTGFNGRVDSAFIADLLATFKKCSAIDIKVVLISTSREVDDT